MEEIKKAEDSVLEAETSEVKEENVEFEKENSEKKKKMDFYIELALFLILGILVGIAVKTEAAKIITIGYDDYKMKIGAQDYDLNKLETDIAKQNAAAAASQGGDGATSGENAAGGTDSGSEGSDNAGAKENTPVNK